MTLIAITENESQGKIDVIPFWPIVTVKEFRDSYRIYTAISDAACLNNLEIAYITVTDALDKYAQLKEQQGITKLEDLERDSERFRQIRLFKEAIYSLAKQKLSEQYLDVDLTRKAGSDKREAVNDNTEILNSNYNIAIRKFLDKPSTYVALV